MAETRDDPDVSWIEPHERGIIPLDQFHLPKRLARTIRTGTYTVRMNTDFAAVIDNCADRDETWINNPIRQVFCSLHQIGYAHSVEVYNGENQLVGGLYGLSIGGAFFGESMFSKARDASKVALATLVGHLRTQGFILLDTQFITDHLKQFGAITIPRDDYLELLGKALPLAVSF